MMHSLFTPAFTKRPKQRNRISSCSIDLLEDRRLLSLTGTLSPIAGFDGTNGENPAALVADSQGNLFGITLLSTNTSQNGSGVVFEIPVNTSTIQVIASLGNGSGTTQGNSLIIDSAGDLFGTTTRSVANGGSTVFEIPHGTTTLQTLATFTVPASPTVNVVDSAGDLYGIGNDDQTLFEIVAGSGTITDLSAPFGANPVPLIDLQMGSDGNLYGVDNAGVLEFSPSTGTATTLASFDTSVFGTSAPLPTGIVLDSNNNVFGFNAYGGPNGGGDAWELPYNSGNISLIASFTTATGSNPFSKPTLYNGTDLLGATSSGGTQGDGTLFDIANVTGAAVTASQSLAVPPVIPADATTGATPAVVTNLGNDEQAPTQDGEGVALTPDEIIFWGQLFGATAEESVGSDGEIFILNSINRPPSGSPPDPSSQQNQLKQEQSQYASEASQAKSAPGASAVHVGTLKQDTDAALESDALRPAATSSLSGQIAAIKTMLALTNKDLKTAATSVQKQTPLVTKYNSDATAITKLQAQLAATTKASTQASVQKKITAETTAQAKVLTQDTTIYNTAGTELTTISTLETTIQSGLDALPAPAISFTGNIASLTAAVKTGKKATAVVVITNQGNVLASGSMEIGLSARLMGTDGSSDIALPPVKQPVHLNPGASTNAHISFLIPTKLPAGTYSLVVQLDSTNVFNESTLPSPIISGQAFTVS